MAANVTLTWIRRNELPVGTRAHVCWNGSIDAYGEGRPTAGAVSQASPLTPQSFEVWAAGKAGFAGEPFGMGVFGLPGNYGSGFGFGEGLLGEGPFGEHVDAASWSTSELLPTLRDGLYKFAVLMEDELGTDQVEPLAEAEVLVAGTPRPPRDPRLVSFAAGVLTVGWTHSPDLR